MAKAKQDEFEFITEKLTGTVEWASVLVPTHKYLKENSKFPNDKEYRVSLLLDTATGLKAFNDMLARHEIPSTVLNPKTGQQVSRARENKNGVLAVQFKRNFVTAQGKEVELQVVDRAVKSIPKDLLIGNGSKATVKLSIMKNKETGEIRSILLAGLQVLEHKTVSASNSDDFTVIDDVAPTTSTKSYSNRTTDNSSPF